MKRKFLKLFLICIFKDQNLAEKLKKMAENLKKSWPPRSSWSSFFPSLPNIRLFKLSNFLTIREILFDWNKLNSWLQQLCGQKTKWRMASLKWLLSPVETSISQWTHNINCHTFYYSYDQQFGSVQIWRPNGNIKKKISNRRSLIIPFGGEKNINKKLPTK